MSGSGTGVHRPRHPGLRRLLAGVYVASAHGRWVGSGEIPAWPASPPCMAIAGLMRRDGESWGNLFGAPR